MENAWLLLYSYLILVYTILQAGKICAADGFEQLKRMKEDLNKLDEREREASNKGGHVHIGGLESMNPKDSESSSDNERPHGHIENLQRLADILVEQRSPFE
jgi:hypothetical protein